MTTQTAQAAQIAYAFNGVCIAQRSDDGYLNATAMCKANGKLFAHYMDNRATRSFLQALETDIGIPISDLIQSKKGGCVQGSWVHPKVAIHLAQWLSPEFAVFVTNLVFDWMTGKLPSAPALPAKTKAAAPKKTAADKGSLAAAATISPPPIAPIDLKAKKVKTETPFTQEEMDYYLGRQSTLEHMARNLAWMHQKGISIKEVTGRANQILGKTPVPPEKVLRVAQLRQNADCERAKEIAAQNGYAYYSIILCDENGPILLDDGSFMELPVGEVLSRWSDRIRRINKPTQLHGLIESTRSRPIAGMDEVIAVDGSVNLPDRVVW